MLPAVRQRKKTFAAAFVPFAVHLNVKEKTTKTLATL
jgi:hypothetical protein